MDVTPEAVKALDDVAVAIDKSSTETAALSAALLADQQSARRREERRFRVVYWSLAGIGVGLAVVLALIWVEAGDRDRRSTLAVDQRVCSDVVLGDVLGRLSTLAMQPRFRTNPDGTAVLDGEGRPIPIPQTEILAQTETLRAGVARSNLILTDISEVCYGPNPDRTPLDGDPNR